MATKKKSKSSKGRRVARTILGAAAAVGSAAAITAAVRKSRRKIRLTDHDRIREWIERRGGRPAAGRPGSGESNLLMIHFPDTSEVLAEQLPWEDFFSQFDRQNLALVCVREPEGEVDLSRDFEFVPR